MSSHSFQGSEIWAWLNQVLSLGYNESKTKVSARAEISLEVQDIFPMQAVLKIKFLCGF